MIRKFRSIEEMNAAQRPVLETDPVRLLQRVSDLYDLAKAICPGTFTGVHKFRSIEESNAFRLSWIRDRAASMRSATAADRPRAGEPNPESS